MRPKILHIAWKFDADSASLNDVDESSSDNYFFAFKNLRNIEKSKSLSKSVAYFGGIFFYLLNKIQCKIKGTDDHLTSLVSRNKINEYIIRQLVAKHEFSEVRIHWVGYGFLPTASIIALANFVRLRVYHHDWYHFTGGVHVPVISKSMFSALESSPNLLSALKSGSITHVLVSRFQEELLHKFRLPNLIIQENKIRPEFSSASLNCSSRDIFINRIEKTNYIFIMFVGIKAGNSDNKGANTVSSILNRLRNDPVFSIGIGCDSSLGFDLSIPRADAKFVYRLFSLIDLSIITSHLETFSMVALESQYCGTPVVYRKSLAPSSFKRRDFLYPATDDSDGSLCSEVEKRLYTKRENLNG